MGDGRMAYYICIIFKTKRQHLRGVGKLGALDPFKEGHERGLVEREEGGLCVIRLWRGMGDGDRD